MKSRNGDGAKGLDHLALLFGQPVMGGTRRQGKVAKKKRQLDDKSRMTGDCHVRICEGLGVKFPRATRLINQELIRRDLPG
jgi:hypothetical protein